MTVEQAISEISALSVDEQLRIVQAIWDRLPDSATLTPTAEACRELERRVAKYTEDPSTLMTEQQLRERMRASRR